MCNGRQIRERIADRYRKLLTDGYSARSFPLLEAAYVYDECEVQLSGWIMEEVYKVVYVTNRGRFVRYDDSGQAHPDHDKTIFSLLAGIHQSLETPLNGFFSYVDQSSEPDVLPHEDYGFAEVLCGEEARRFMFRPDE